MLNGDCPQCNEQVFFHLAALVHCSIKTDQNLEQDPASTMQKTGWTIHSFFLVLSGLKKSFTLDMITRGQSTTIFLCIGPFSAWSRTNKQPGDPSASLPLTSVRRQSFAIHVSWQKEMAHQSSQDKRSVRMLGQ